jgi:phage shock protein A
MTMLKRISTTFISKVDRVVAHVENHDAVVEASLKDLQTALAKARIRLNRIQKDGKQLNDKISELTQAEASWESRAELIAVDDKSKALECIRRRNHCRVKIIQTQSAATRHDELEQQVEETVVRMEERANELSSQRNQMRSRQSAANAMQIINKIEGEPQGSIDDAFERWEEMITETEYKNGTYNSAKKDSLDNEFTEMETTSVLEADLDSLLNPKK